MSQPSGTFSPFLRKYRGILFSSYLTYPRCFRPFLSMNPIDVVVGIAVRVGSTKLFLRKRISSFLVVNVAIRPVWRPSGPSSYNVPTWGSSGFTPLSQVLIASSYNSGTPCCSNHSLNAALVGRFSDCANKRVLNSFRTCLLSRSSSRPHF